MLTDRAKEDFELWVINNLNKIVSLPDKTLLDGFYTSGLTFQYAYIIEFFDSVGLYVDVYSKFTLRFSWKINFKNIEISSTVFESRKEALKSAIKKANAIYNLNE